MHPTEVLPKLAYNAVGHYFPKDPIDRAVPVGPNRFYKRVFDGFAHLDSVEKMKSEKADLAKASFNMFGSYIRDMRTVGQDYLFGPMNPVNDIFKKLARRTMAAPYTQVWSLPYRRIYRGGLLAYLIGNKRSDFAGAADKPPAFWRDAYHVWHEQLWEGEGLVPRFLQGRGLKIKEGLSSWGGMTPVKARNTTTQIGRSSQIRSRRRDTLKKGDLDEQLKASGMSDRVSLAISFSIENVHDD
ncbi:MAG: hypothetical protein Q9166_003725 [cf. Caloplaca sp. 2 TL-2023]